MDKPTNKHNDHPHDANNNNNDDDDVNCFPQQDKQSVPPQDISPTNTLPSLIEYLTDKSTNTPTNTNNDESTNDITSTPNRTNPDDDDGYKNTNNYEICFQNMLFFLKQQRYQANIQ